MRHNVEGWRSQALLDTRERFGVSFGAPEPVGNVVGQRSGGCHLIDTATKDVDATLPRCACAPGERPSRAAARARRGIRGHLALIPTIALALLPKCPLCLAAYLGVFGCVGAGAWLGGVRGEAVEAVLLVLAVGVVASRGARYGDWRPSTVGLAGAVALAAGKFVLNAPAIVVAGACALVGASVWSASAARAPVRPA
jgi:hypothetical protein